MVNAKLKLSDWTNKDDQLLAGCLAALKASGKLNAPSKSRAPRLLREADNTKRLSKFTNVIINKKVAEWFSANGVSGAGMSTATAFQNAATSTTATAVDAEAEEDAAGAWYSDMYHITEVVEGGQTSLWVHFDMFSGYQFTACLETSDTLVLSLSRTLVCADDDSCVNSEQELRHASPDVSNMLLARGLIDQRTTFNKVKKILDGNFGKGMQKSLAAYEAQVKKIWIPLPRKVRKRKKSVTVIDKTVEGTYGEPQRICLVQLVVDEEEEDGVVEIKAYDDGQSHRKRKEVDLKIFNTPKKRRPLGERTNHVTPSPFQ